MRQISDLKQNEEIDHSSLELFAEHALNFHGCSKLLGRFRLQKNCEAQIKLSNFNGAVGRVKISGRSDGEVVAISCWQKLDFGRAFSHSDSLCVAFFGTHPGQPHILDVFSLSGLK